MTSETDGGPQRRQIDMIDLLGRFAPLIFLLVLIVAFWVAEPRFVIPLNLTNIVLQVSVTGLLAIGMTFVILTAGIDLSVGSLLAFAGLVGAAVAKGGLDDRFAVGAATEAAGYGWGLAMLAAIAIGMIGGFLQGSAITWLRVPPFVVTLGGMSVFRGAALLFSGGGPISGFSDDFKMWGKERLFREELGNVGLPLPALIFIGFAILAYIVLRYTRFGRHVYAVGGNLEAARLSGLNVKLIITSVYVIMGFFAGLGAFVLSARLDSAEAVAGQGYELTVIASVVIGGTSLFGGQGSVVGTVIGALLIGVMLNGLQLNNVSSYIQQIVIGLVIVLAVAFDLFLKSRRKT